MKSSAVGEVSFWTVFSTRTSNIVKTVLLIGNMQSSIYLIYPARQKYIHAEF